MTPVHTICLFISGYFVSRLMARLNWHSRIVYFLLRRFGNKPGIILFSLMGGCAALSLVLPNALTVLALLPVIKLICRRNGEPISHGAVTACVLAVIYGANIGGTGSLIGSPANLYLLLTLEMLETPGRETINFFSWFLFGFPLMLLLLFSAWSLLTLLTPGHVMLELSDLRLPQIDPGDETPPADLRKKGIFSLAAVAFLHAAVMLSTAINLPDPEWQIFFHGRRFFMVYSDLAALGVTIVTSLFIFTARVKTGNRNSSNNVEREEKKEKLLPLDQLVGNIPWRGLLMVFAAIAAVFLAALFGGRKTLAYLASNFVIDHRGELLLIFTMVIICLFFTEVLSNTTVSTILFPAAVFMSIDAGFNPLPIAIAVSLASTCAFMTPIATPVNALAFGAVKGVNIRTMLSTGALVNLVSGALISLWTLMVVPRILNLFS